MATSGGRRVGRDLRDEHSRIVDAKRVRRMIGTADDRQTQRGAVLNDIVFINLGLTYKCNEASLQHLIIDTLSYTYK